jgi:hypothetical protein
LRLLAPHLTLRNICYWVMRGGGHE